MFQMVFLKILNLEELLLAGPIVLSLRNVADERVVCFVLFFTSYCD